MTGIDGTSPWPSEDTDYLEEHRLMHERTLSLTEAGEAMSGLPMWTMHMNISAGGVRKVLIRSLGDVTEGLSRVERKDDKVFSGIAITGGPIQSQISAIFKAECEYSQESNLLFVYLESGVITLTSADVEHMAEVERHISAALDSRATDTTVPQPA